MPPPPTVSVPVMEGGAKVKVPVPLSVMLFVMLRPLKEVALEVARVMAPVWVVPYVCLIEETPFCIEEVATHCGMPPLTARTKPPVPMGSAARELVPLA